MTAYSASANFHRARPGRGSVVAAPTDLEVHKVEQLVHLWPEHVHCLLVDLHSVGLLVGLWLRDGARTAAPGVQHHRVLVTLFQQLVLRTARSHVTH